MRVLLSRIEAEPHVRELLEQVSMTRTSVISAVVGALLISAHAEAAPFKDFTSNVSGFKVQLPSPPKKDTQTAAGVDVKTYTVQENDGAYVVAVAEIPIPAGESAAKIEARLDGARDGMVRNIHAKLKSSSRITLNGRYPGREVQATLPNKKGIVRAKIFIVDQRLYQVLVIGTTSWATSDDANRFLNSFALTR